MIRAILLMSTITLLPCHAVAQDLSLPGNAMMMSNDRVATGQLDVPTSGWTNGKLQTTPVPGAVVTEVWQIDAARLNTAPILRSLRDQLTAQGFDIGFECQDRACGGFDFRFAIPVAAPPEMQVDLGNFRFLSATADDRAVTLLVSATPQKGFVQIMRVAPSLDQLDTAQAEAPSLRAPVSGSSELAADLTNLGRTILWDVTFDTGAVTLSDDPVPSLQALSRYLAQNPDLAVSIVGHTDATGSLDSNIAISKRRAAAVVERLVSDYDVPRAQLRAEGMGYLSPVATNLTDKGRSANRRVEAVVTGRR